MKTPICNCGHDRTRHNGTMGTGSCLNAGCWCPYFKFDHFRTDPDPVPEPVDPRIPGLAFTVLNDDPNHEPDPD